MSGAKHEQPPQQIILPTPITAPPIHSAISLRANEQRVVRDFARRRFGEAWGRLDKFSHPLLVCSQCDDQKTQRSGMAVGKAEQDGMAVGLFVEAIADHWGRVDVIRG